MKKIFIISHVILSLGAYAQKHAGTSLPSMGPTSFTNDNYASDANVSFVTPAKDTIFLQDDVTGKMIKQIWERDNRYSGKKPVIVMVPNLAAVIKSRKARPNKKL